MSIFISTGELSGDIYATRLSAALQKLVPQEEIWGMAGTLASGIKKEWNNDQLHIIGLGRIVKSLPALYALRNELADAVIRRKPRAVIVIDSPDFHIPLLSKIRAGGYKGAVIYVCPPTIWAWRNGRAKYLRRYCDLCLPLFSFEEKALKERDVKSFWCGNPLVDDFKDFAPSGAALPSDPTRVALLPGSRRSEIASLLPVLEQTALRLQVLGLHPVLSVAPGLDPESRDMVLHNASGIESTEVSGRNLMHASKFVIGSCGTAAVEAMFLDRYMIVLYRGTFIEWHIYKALTHTKFVAVPNVLAGRMFFPELLQDDVKVENVMNYAERYLSDQPYREDVHRQLRENRLMMGEPGAIGRWADAICRVMARP